MYDSTKRDKQQRKKPPAWAGVLEQIPGGFEIYDSMLQSGVGVGSSSSNEEPFDSSIHPADSMLACCASAALLLPLALPWYAGKCGRSTAV